MHLTVVGAGAGTRAAGAIPLTWIHSACAHGAARAIGVMARRLMLGVPCDGRLHCRSATTRARMTVARLAVRPTGLLVVPVRLWEAVRAPPGVVRIVDVRYEFDILCAGVGDVICVFVVVTVALRAVQPLKRRQDDLVRGKHQLALDHAATRNDEYNHLRNRRGRSSCHLVRLTCCVQSETLTFFSRAMAFQFFHFTTQKLKSISFCRL